MSKDPRNPLFPLALAGLLLGALGQTNWFVLYAGMLFGFSVVVGLRHPPRMMRWILLLAAGTPVAEVVWHLSGWSTTGQPWFVDAFLRTGGALLAILPGLGAGLLYRRLSPRLRKASA